MAGAELNIGKLEEEAIKRREKLKSLKRKREGKQTQNENSEKESDESVTLPKPLFRSYKPANEELNQFSLESGAPGDVTAEVNKCLF